MANGKLLRQLIKAGLERDDEAFRSASEAVIDEERSKQHHLLANDLEKILYGQSSHIARNTLRQLPASVPTDQERGFPLLELRQPVRELTDIILSDDVRVIIDELLLQHHRSDLLRSYGLAPSERVLFFGPPGCGKTLAAEVIANELDRPLAIVRVDSVISSYLGETSANLRKVFDFVNSMPMVVLFDEFDALAKERSDGGDHGELKRVVNSVLQMMDAYRGSSLLIAATNHQGLLDSAIWRRFEEVIQFSPPNSDQVKRLLQLKLRGVRRQFEPDDSAVASLFTGMSHADIERILRRAIKEMILQGREFLTVIHLESSLAREKARKIGKS